MRALILLLAVGCSSADDELPTECNPRDRRGTYLVQYTHLDGNCGRLPDELVILPADASDVDGAGCVVDSARWSDGDCRFDTEVVCGDGSKLVGFSRAQDSSGHELVGRMTLTGLNCRSTYDVTWTRQ